LVPYSFNIQYSNLAVYRDVQFTLASTIYFTLSRLFPAKETMLDHAIVEQEEPPYDGSISGSDEKKVDVYRVDEAPVA
jgi:hypothetical protein